MVGLLRLRDLRGARVPAVADGVDEERLGKDPLEASRRGDREAAHLDQPGLAIAKRTQEIEEELAARGDDFWAGAVLDPGRRVLEAAGGGLEGVPGNDFVKSSLLALATGSPARTHKRPLADADPVPPVAPELGQERGRRRRAGHHLGKALRVGVEAALDRDRMERRMAADQVRDDVRAAAARAADEDEG